MRTVYTNGTLFTMDPENRIIEEGMLIVDNATIEYIGHYAADILTDYDQLIDLKRKWVLPGLVNTHSHVLMTMLRGIGDDMQLKTWLETKVFPLEAQYDTEIATISAQLGILEM